MADENAKLHQDEHLAEQLREAELIIETRKAAALLGNMMPEINPEDL
jgi:hypothetical protein